MLNINHGKYLKKLKIDPMIFSFFVNKSLGELDPEAHQGHDRPHDSKNTYIIGAEARYNDNLMQKWLIFFFLCGESIF